MYKLLALNALAFGGLTGADAEHMSVEEFVKIRCSLDGSDTFYTWKGSIFSSSVVPQQEPIHILDFIGFNVGRCEKIDGKWKLITREISYYLNPVTKEKLQSWDNPYTNETVTVVHVANNPVNGGMSALPYTMVSKSTGVIDSDIPLFYPNKLATNESYYEYGGDVEYYESSELFKFYFDVEDLKASENQVDDVPISWTRTGQWLPWMHMGKVQGTIIYSCSGGRAKDLSGMPQWLQDDIENRLPLYLSAPDSVEEVPNQTSQLYFMDHFDEYLAGEQFPLPAPKK